MALTNPFNNANNNLRSDGSQSTPILGPEWEDLASTACIIRRQLEKMKKDYLASQKLFKNQKKRCIENVLKENNDLTAILTNTRIIKSVLESSSTISMTTLAGILRYVQPMLFSSYTESQAVAVNLLKIIKDQYWKDILKTCKLEVDDFADFKEQARVNNARKAKDLLANIAMNATGVRLHSASNAYILNTCKDTFMSF